MTPQKLKNSILQLAVQGKLVEQRPEEGTGEELYQEIRAKKQRLIKAGTLKKEKPLPEITEDEIPFDLPEGWRWARLESLCSLITDGTHKTPSYTTSGIRFLSVKDISDGYFDLSNTKFISASEHSQLTQRCKPEMGDVLICRIGTLGKALSIDIDLEFSIFVSLGLIKPIHKELAKYIETVINSGYGYAWIQRVKVGGGTHTFKINLDDLRMFLIPLPPLAEQKRIVAKIEELLPLIDRYEQAWSALEAFNKRFPVDMQKSILQMAIQGKLVPQLPEEGTGEELFQQIQAEKQRVIKAGVIKKEKPLPEIAEDEIPFDIPESWDWVRLGQLIHIESGKGLTAAQMRKGNIPVYGGNGITGYHDESLLHEETVVIGRVGFYCGSVHVTEKECWVTDNAFITTYPQNCIDRAFLVYMLRHMDLGQNNNATAQPVVSGKKIYPMLFPLPPLAEQKRIVAKLKEILPLCERLK